MGFRILAHKFLALKPRFPYILKKEKTTMYLGCNFAISRDCYCNTVETSRKTKTLHLACLCCVAVWLSWSICSSSKASMALIAFSRTNENH